MNIYGFMHVYTVNNWRQIVNEQLIRISQSGLFGKINKLFVGVIGNKWTDHVEDVDIIYQINKPELEQSLTLSFLRMFSMETDAYIFYIHTKGVSHGPSIPQTDWRRMMEYFVIDQHDICISQLEWCDIVGVNWHLGEGYMNASSSKTGGIKVTPHFSGNFWWAKTDYVRKLPALFPLKNKYECEFWIGKGNPKISELWNSGVYHHRKPYPSHNYMDKKNIRHIT
ncbi:MAG: hypothetical protein ACXADW_21965 [Candidatus Hodarchaeales archaeon]|jgi:hypothetical protein